MVDKLDCVEPKRITLDILQGLCSKLEGRVATCAEPGGRRPE